MFVSFTGHEPQFLYRQLSNDPRRWRARPGARLVRVGARIGAHVVSGMMQADIGGSSGQGAGASLFSYRCPLEGIEMMTKTDTNNHGDKQILSDGVSVIPYSPSVCMDDEAGSEREETRGHVWRLAVDPDYDGYLDRDEGFSLFVEITDHEMPIAKAAYKRIYAAAEELRTLARSIEVEYSLATRDIEPVLESSSSEWFKEYRASWGEAIVPNVHIKHEPEVFDVDEDDNEIPGSRGHSHCLKFDCEELSARGLEFVLLDYIDDRDGDLKESAARRLWDASDQLRDTAIELSPAINPGDGDFSVVISEAGQPDRTTLAGVSQHEAEGYAKGINSVSDLTGKRARVVHRDMEAPHTAEQLSRLMVEITGGNAPRYVIEFGDPRKRFCEHHNANSPDGSVARIIENPTSKDQPDISFK